MSERRHCLALNCEILGNRRTLSDEWQERARRALDIAAPAGVSRLLEGDDIKVSPTEAIDILAWLSEVPGWSEEFVVKNKIGDGAVFTAV